ncbi:hypothetical protein [uncultured Shewanella sp.]|uniref:hypothetical protein n=1 Tax=uncultured Shewanella sp. TaxID=173975 RepID=UPI002634BFAA|nr:hypothetical protein [uncultured Shewanella sp.]
MELSEFINQILLPFGGVSAVLIALAAFLGNVNTKRIINGDLAKHKMELEAFKARSNVELQALKDNHAKDLELVRLEHASKMDEVQSQFKTEFLKYEAYASISKEKYQDLFERRISVYSELLSLKREIDDSIVENAEMLEIHDDDPSHFTNAVAKISKASQENLMLISNELATLSNKLNSRSSQVFRSAKVTAFFANMHSYETDSPNYEAIMDAEDSELRNMFSECGDLYESWFKQLEKDVSKIRAILDFSGEFLEKATNKSKHADAA